MDHLSSHIPSAYQEFADRCVVITGANSGIGWATALAFAETRANLARLDVARTGLDETVELTSGDSHVAVECDISDISSVASVFSRIDDVLGPVDVLVNNAGINPPVNSTLDVDVEYFDRVMNVNANGLFFCAQAALRSMVPRGAGTIVNLGSVSGMIGWGGSAVYSALKGAARALIKALAVEFTPYSIRVNAVAPGSVRAQMVENNSHLQDNADDAWKQTAALHPIGRIGVPE